VFLFILPIVIASSLTTLFTVTTGMNFVIFGVAAMEWQRRRGYKGGEGRLTERENGMYYGVGMDKESDHDLTRDLGRLVQVSPSVFEPYMGKKYDFTKSEGEMLRAILMPAIQSLNELEGVKIELETDPSNEDLQAALFLGVENLGRLISPIITYLQQFPSKRIKKV